MSRKAVVEIKLRAVVSTGSSKISLHDAVANFLNRALQADIPVDLYTEGLVEAKLVDLDTIYEWEEG